MKLKTHDFKQKAASEMRTEKSFLNLIKSIYIKATE